MFVQHRAKRGVERWALGCLAAAALAACGGQTLDEATEASSRADTAQDDALFAPGMVPTSSQANAVAGAGGAPAEHEPVAGGTGGWTGTAGVGSTGVAGGSWTGVGGSARTQEPCDYPYFPEVDWAPSEWVAWSTRSDEGAFAPAPSVRRTMVGSWRGLVQTPWTSPYLVDITFEDDGHYSASTPELGDCAPAFYYGTDDDTPIKRWRVEDASGVTAGEIDIAFDYHPEPGVIEYGLPAWQGELAAIERDASGDGLRFEFSRSDGYGPLRFDLRRRE